MSDQILEARNVTKRFGGLVAVSEVRLEVAEGSIHSLIGPNGSGKSTFLNLVNGIYRLDEGELLFNGKVINGLRPYEVARLGVGRTFQNIRLFKHLTVLQNVMVAQHHRDRPGLLPTILRTPSARQTETAARESALSALDFLDLKHLAEVQATSLPHGQQRLVEIARALVMGPRLLLLDEPAAGLNPTETETLMERIRSINRNGVTILLVEHNMRLVMDISDQVTVLDFGRRIAHGHPDDVKNDPRVIEAYLGSEVDLSLAGSMEGEQL